MGLFYSAATYKKYDAKGTVRRRTSTRGNNFQSTGRRPSPAAPAAAAAAAANDLGSLLPDLSGMAIFKMNVCLSILSIFFSLACCCPSSIKCIGLLFSENLSNEERTWEEIMQIKAMPVSMAQKKDHKVKLQVRVN